MSGHPGPASSGPSHALPALRFGRLHGAGSELTADWLLKRNCSISPRQLLAAYGLLCAMTLTIAVFFLLQGAPLVLPFAGLELLGLGAAMLLQARHAADRERLELLGGRLSVECRLGETAARVEFQTAGLRVEAGDGGRALIELSGQGRRVAVGRFVRPEQRRALADELRAVLARFASAGTPLAAA